MSQGDNTCAACKQAITRKHYSILCFLCDNWCHNKCVDLSISQIKYYESELKKQAGERWTCPSCLRETVRKSQTARKSLCATQSDPVFSNTPPASAMSVTLEDIMNKLNSMELANKDLRDMYNKQTEVNNLLRSEIKNLNSRLATAEVQLQSLTRNTPEEANEELVRECIDREKRKSNIIIFGQPESINDIQDNDSVKAILNTLCPEFDASNILEVSRIGNRRDQQSDVTRARPLKVRFKNVTSSLEVFKHCHKLKNSTQLRHITISSDRTARQRQLYRSVRLQLVQRKNAGETNIGIKHIRGVPTIVSLTMTGDQSEN